MEVCGHLKLRTTFTDGIASCTENIRYLIVNAPSAVGGGIVDKAHEDEATRLGGKGDYHQVRSKGGQEVLREQP